MAAEPRMILVIEYLLQAPSQEACIEEIMGLTDPEIDEIHSMIKVTINAMKAELDKIEREERDNFGPSDEGSSGDRLPTAETLNNPFMTAADPSHAPNNLLTMGQKRKRGM